MKEEFYTDNQDDDSEEILVMDRWECFACGHLCSVVTKDDSVPTMCPLGKDCDWKRQHFCI